MFNIRIKVSSCDERYPGTIDRTEGRSSTTRDYPDPRQGGDLKQVQTVQIISEKMFGVNFGFPDIPRPFNTQVYL